MKHTLKVVLYARFSPRPNAAECESVANQLTELREYCTARGWRIVAEFFDEDVSGSELGRPGLMDAIGSLRRGYLLLVRDLSRLWRSEEVTYIVRREVAAKRATIVSAAGEGTSPEATDDPEAKFMQRLFDALAERQRAHIRNATSRAMKRHQADGRRMSKEPPYGWQVDPLSEPHASSGLPTRIVESQYEQAVIAKITAWRAEADLTLREIAKRLNTSGLTCRGAKWHHEKIRRILQRARPSGR